MTTRSAGLEARVAGYLVDSVILVSFGLMFLVIAGFQLLLTSDFGDVDPPDSSLYAFVAIPFGGTIIGWTLFNVALLWWRAQTAGQYVAGIRVQREDGSAPTRRQVLAWWLLLHPLFFHPLLALLWFLDVLVVVSLTVSEAALGIGLFFVLLCLIAPLIALAAAALDRQRRALHDRLAGIVVVRAE
jgi:uncharacterized RDD family membrane protein YckC